MSKQHHQSQGNSLSEEKFKGIFEVASDGLIYMDTSGRIVDVNEQAVRIFGGSKEDLLGKHFTRVGVVSSTNLPRITKAFASILLGRGAPLEVQIRNKKGQMRFLECSYSVMKTDGKLAGILAIARDITERKKAERALLESQQKFERLFSGIPEAAVFVDARDHVQDINSRFSELFGYSSEEALGKALDDLIVPADKREEAEILTQKSMVGYVDHETVRKRKDGLSIPVLMSAAPVTLEGQYTGCVVLYRDIAERKKIEEQLRESEERLRGITERSFDAILAMDLEGRITFVSFVAERIIGYKPEEIKGKSLHTFFAEREIPKAAQAFAEVASGKSMRGLELELLRKDGSSVTVEVNGAPIIKDGKVVGVQATARDISERKQMQQKLQEYSEELEALVEKRTRQLKEAQDQLVKSERLAAIGQVAAMVGHDLRNPLTGIKGAAYYLKTKPALRKDKKTMEMLELIEKDIEYSNKIITDLLEYSRDVHLELTETTPKLIIGETLSPLEVPNNIQVINLTESDPRIKADIEKLNRAFVNLIKNAIDAMPYGGKLAIKSTGTNDNVEFTFADTGMGMTKEQMGKIWAPFFTTKAKGMGLGLPICKGIIEAHKGYITVESMPGIGTTFTVTIPIEPKPTEGGEKVWVNVPESLSSMTTKASEKS
jgi:PAS domain S-box-containing protein